MIAEKTGTEFLESDLKPEGFSIPHTHIISSSIGINFLSLALPVMTLQVYDRILPNPESGTLSVIVTGVLVAITLEAILRLARAYLISWGGATYENGMSAKALAHVVNGDLSTLSQCRTGEHLHRLSALGKIKDFFNGYSLSAVIDLCFIPVYLGFIIYIAGPLAFVPATGLMAFCLISLAGGHKLRKHLATRDKSDDARYNFLIESLENIHEIKSLTAEKFFCSKYKELERKSSLSNFETAECTARSFNAGTVMSHVMMAAVIAAGAWFVLQGMVTAGALIATLLLSGRMMQMVQRGLVLWVKYQDHLHAIDKVRDIFNAPHNIRSISTLQQDGENRPICSLKDITFSYEEAQEPILRNLFLDIQEGTSLHISGDPGAGKTTLLKLIACIYHPQTGTIAVPHGVADNIVGLVTTSPVLFRGTLRDNLTCYGSTDLRIALMYAKKTGLDRDIAALPFGLDTFIQGDGNESITQHMRQLVSIVRIMATRPKVLLFDDAMSGLDRDSRKRISEALADMQPETCLVLTGDDPLLIGIAKHRVTLAGGRIVPTGGHNGGKPRTFTLPDAA